MGTAQLDAIKSRCPGARFWFAPLQRNGTRSPSRKVGASASKRDAFGAKENCLCAKNGRDTIVPLDEKRRAQSFQNAHPALNPVLGQFNSVAHSSLSNVSPDGQSWTLNTNMPNTGGTYGLLLHFTDADGLLTNGGL